MRRTLVAALMLGLSGGASADDSVRLVIKVTGHEQEGGSVVLTLQSGAKIRVHPDDVDMKLTEALIPLMMTEGLAAEAPSKEAITTHDQRAEMTFRAKCARDWPDDFRMRAFCEKTQREALATLRARPAGSSTMTTIRRKCTGDWPDDFRMRNFCEERQLEGLQQLGR